MAEVDRRESYSAGAVARKTAKRPLAGERQWLSGGPSKCHATPRRLESAGSASCRRGVHWRWFGHQTPAHTRWLQILTLPRQRTGALPIDLNAFSTTPSAPSICRHDSTVPSNCCVQYSSAPATGNRKMSRFPKLRCDPFRRLVDCTPSVTIALADRQNIDARAGLPLRLCRPRWEKALEV